MKPFTLILGIVLSFILLGGMASPIFATSIAIPLSRKSARNQVLDFYAGGSSDTYTLRISPQGGTMSMNDETSISWMPWSYATSTMVNRYDIHHIPSQRNANELSNRLPLPDEFKHGFHPTLVRLWHQCAQHPELSRDATRLQPNSSHLPNRNAKATNPSRIPNIKRRQRAWLTFPPRFEFGRMVQRH